MIDEYDNSKNPDGRGELDEGGWEDISSLTGGVQPEQIPELHGVRDLEAIYPLLHSLVGRTSTDLLVRAAALESIVGAERAILSSTDLAECLWWLDDPARDSVLSVLRRSGWLEHDASAGGTSITDAGRWAYDVLAFLHRRLRESELLPTVAGIEYALAIGVDPLRHLVSMRARLTKLREDIEAARASHSEVVLRRMSDRLGDVLALSEQIRAVTDRIPLDNVEARRVVREVHDLLSRLHGVGSELHRDVTDIGRQYIRLTGGLTSREIVEALMNLDLQELVQAGQDALLPVMKAPPLLTTEVVASAAEQQALRERPQPVDSTWSEPPEVPRSVQTSVAPADVMALLREIEAIAAGDAPLPLAELVPRNTHSESFLRLSLLALAGDPRAGEGIAARIGSVPVDLRVQGDGWPDDLAEGGPLTGLTPGELGPREKRNGSDG